MNETTDWRIAALQLIDAAEREMSALTAWDYARRAAALARAHGEVSGGILGSQRWPDTRLLKRIIEEA